MTVHGINNRVFNEMQQSMLCNGIHASLYKNVYKLNYERSTIIQEYAMPIIMNGKDIIARTQNGSGKTVSTYLQYIVINKFEIDHKIYFRYTWYYTGITNHAYCLPSTFSINIINLFK